MQPRRLVQGSVLGLSILLPYLYLYAMLQAAGDRITLLEVPLWRFFSAVFYRFGDDPGSMARLVTGIPGWSLSLGPLGLSDPLAALAPNAWTPGLLLSLLLPVGLTLLVGRYFCGWVCPAGFLSEAIHGVRRFLLARGLKLPSWRLGTGVRYWLLGLGAAYSLLTGMLVFPWLYPPALLGREIFMGVAFAQIGVGTALLVALGLVELLVMPRVWCTSLCPGGAAYALFSRFRLLRIRREAAACVGCNRCVEVCPFEQSPMTDRIGADCAACGACLKACPTKALAVHLPVIATPFRPEGTP